MARRCLDLPDYLLPVWRISADNCLVFGASIFGGRKYFLPTAAMHYRIHGNNGWWSKRTPDSDYLGRLRSHGLIAFYARRAGLDESCIKLAKREFLTKPEPTWREAKRYARIALRGDTGWFRNANRAFSILRRAWLRRGIPVETSGKP